MLPEKQLQEGKGPLWLNLCRVLSNFLAKFDFQGRNSLATIYAVLAELKCVHVFQMLSSTKEASFLSETLWDLMDLPQSTDNLFLVKFSGGAF